jgi:hypothetical protein
MSGLLHRPRAAQVRGHALDTDMACADLDHKEHTNMASWMAKKSPLERTALANRSSSS